MPDVHSKYAPSSASRWLKCPGSAGLSDPGGEAADEGTLLHAAAHAILTGGYDPGGLDEEQAEAVMECVEYARGLAGLNGFYTERRIESEWIADFGGTIDFAIDFGEELHVLDFKFGRQLVSPHDNKQLLSYLCLARELIGRRGKYFGHIIQPRAGQTDCAEYTNDDLDAHEFDVVEATASDRIVPGEHCRYCPIRLTCEVRHEYDRVMRQEAFRDDEPTAAWCLEVIECADVLAERAKDANAALFKRAMRGETIPGHYLGHSFGNRQWKDEDEAAAWLSEHADEEKIYKRTLVSPAQAEKIKGVPKKEVNALTEKPDKGPALVRKGSRLKPWIRNDKSVFED